MGVVQRCPPWMCSVQSWNTSRKNKPWLLFLPPLTHSPLSSFRFQGVRLEALQASEDRMPVTSTNDVMKLFNDAQQNMLYLNQQRLKAVEELRKVEKEKELLLAEVGQLEAEHKASVTECKALRQQLQVLEVQSAQGTWDFQKSGTKEPWQKMDTPSIFSELLLWIDSMVLSDSINSSEANGLRRLVVNGDTQAIGIFYNLRNKGDTTLLKDLRHLIDSHRRYPMHVVHVATELFPIAESGSLARHVTGLSRALRRKGNLVEVILPKYDSIDLSQIQNLQELESHFHSFFGGSWHKNKVWTGIIHGIAVTLVEPCHPGGFFSRDHLYGFTDDFERFTYFCRATLDYLIKSGKRPDVLHLHNWQTAAVAPLFWDIFADQGMDSTRILFTCHDFKQQCVEEPQKLALSGLDPQKLHQPDRLQDNRDPRFVNLLKGGIVYSNRVTTVSPIYAKDVMIMGYGHGLESTLAIHKDKFIGISDGVDETLWSPRSDSYLPRTYSADDLSGKICCKEELRKQLNLSTSNNSIPLVCCVAPQASDLELELLKAALNCTLMRGGQFVVMGASKDPEMQLSLQKLQQYFKKKDMCIVLEYNESFFHLMVAASDIMVCVSANEPDDQIPLIAMQYGSVPVVRQSDFLKSRMIDAENVPYGNERMPFTFQPTNGADLMLTLSQAIDKMNSDCEGWKRLVQNGMLEDFSWDSHSVKAYIDCYHSIHCL